MGFSSGALGWSVLVVVQLDSKQVKAQYTCNSEYGLVSELAGRMEDQDLGKILAWVFIFKKSPLVASEKPSCSYSEAKPMFIRPAFYETVSVLFRWIFSATVPAKWNGERTKGEEGFSG